MSTKAKLAEDLKEAMRARDTVRLEAIRSVRAAITLREVEAGRELDDAGVFEIIRSLRKQRVESIEQYRAGGREDLASQEEREKTLLEAYLPAAPDRATIEGTVRTIITELDAKTIKDMGRVMAGARDRLPFADGKLLSEVVRAQLTTAS